MLRTVEGLVLLLAGGVGLHATIIFSEGNTPGSFSQKLTGPGFRTYAEVGWQTGGAAYSNVTIAVTLMGSDAGGDLFDAYLSNTIGAGATALDSAVGITAPAGGYSSITLFTGLSLLANTDYYVTIAPESGEALYWGIDNSQPALVLDTGVTFLSPPGFCTDDSGNCDEPPYTSSFQDLGAIPIISVTSGASVPEPASGSLLAAGLAIGALVRWRARSSLQPARR